MGNCPCILSLPIMIGSGWPEDFIYLLTVVKGKGVVWAIGTIVYAVVDECIEK